MTGIGRIFEAHILELLEEEGHALETVSAVAVPAVGQEADHRLIDLDAVGGLRPVRRDRALRPLRRDRAGAVRDQKSDQDLDGQHRGLGRPLPRQGQEQQLACRPAPEPLVARDAPQVAVPMVLGRDRGADHDAVEAQVPRQRFSGKAGDALAHQRAPRDRGRDGGQDRVAR